MPAEVSGCRLVDGQRITKPKAREFPLAGDHFSVIEAPPAELSACPQTSGNFLR